MLPKLFLYVHKFWVFHKSTVMYCTTVLKGLFVELSFISTEEISCVTSVVFKELFAESSRIERKMARDLKHDVLK